MKDRVERKRGRLGLLAMVGLLVLSFSPAEGAVLSVEDLQFGLFNSPFFNDMNFYDAGTSMFYVDGVGSVGMKVNGDTNLYRMTALNNTLTLEMSPIISDTSSGGLASGTFDYQVGGVKRKVTISGAIWDLADSNAPVFSGDVLIAEVVAEFVGLEKGGAGTTLQFNQTIKVIGGELSGDIADGKVTDLMMQPNLEAIYTFFNVTRSAGGAVNDFSGDLEFGFGSGSGVQIHDVVPEPVTALLLGLGSLAMVSRRKKQ